MITSYSLSNVHIAYLKSVHGYDFQNKAPDFEQIYEDYVVLELESGMQFQDFSMFEPIDENHVLNKKITLFDHLVEQGYFFKNQDQLIHKPNVGVW